MVDPVSAGSMAMKAAELANKLYGLLKTSSYGDVGILISIRLRFNEAVKLDDWRTRIYKTLSKNKIPKPGQVGEPNKYIEVVQINEELIGFPLIDALDDSLEAQDESELENIYYVRSGVVEARPRCSERNCLREAVGILNNIASEFEGQISSARIYLSFRFDSQMKASNFYEKVNSIKDQKSDLLGDDVRIERPSKDNTVKISVSPYKVWFIDDIESILFKKSFIGKLISKAKGQ